jgi:hypothetical protein
MGNGRLLEGIGYGPATVFNPNQAIQNFGNIIAQQRMEQKAKDDALIKQMATLKSDAIRDADTADYRKQYDDWKNTAIEANRLPKNSRQRLDAIAYAQAKYNDLGSFINKSKEQKSHESSLGNMLLSNPHLFSDDAHGQVLKSFASPMSKSEFIPSDKYSTLERYIDPEKIDEGFTKLKSTLLKGSEWSNPIQSQGKDKQGNKTGVIVHSERAVAPESLLSTYAHAYDIDPNVRAFVDKKYNDIGAEDPQHAKMLRLKQYAIDRGELKEGQNGQLITGVVEKSKPEFKPNYAPDKYYAHFDYRQGNKEPTEPSYFEDLSERMRRGVAGSGEEFTQNLIQNPDYHHGATIDTRNPKAITIRIPAKYKYDPKLAKPGVPNSGRVVVKPAYTVTLDSTDPNQWTAGFSRIYKDITGDANANPTKAMTFGGKGKVPGGLSKSTTKKLSKGSLNDL